MDLTGLFWSNGKQSLSLKENTVSGLTPTNHTAAIMRRIYYADCKRQRSETAGRPARVRNTAAGRQPPGLDP